MIKLLFSYIKNQSLHFKILLMVALLLFFVATVYAVKLSYAKDLLLNSQKEKIIELNKQIKSSEKRTTKIINKGKTKTNSIKKVNDNIDNKLKRDAKIIDNDSITDNNILIFAKSYER